MQAIILAAGLGRRLKEYTENTSKCLLKIGNHTIFELMVNTILEIGINEIFVVVGHAADQVIQTIKDSRVHFIFNPDYATSNSIVSLSLALPFIHSSFFSLPCDLVFESSVLEVFLKRKEGIVMAVDRTLSSTSNGTMVTLDGSRIIKVSKEIPNEERHGEITGMQAFFGDKVKLLKRIVFELIQKGNINWLNSDVLNWMIQKNLAEVTIADITGHKWCEVDNESDLIRARCLFGK